MSRTVGGDEQACQSVLLRFFQALDAGEAQAAADCVDSEFTWCRHGKTLVGSDVIAKVIAERSPHRIVRHHLTNLVVTLESEDCARSKAYYAVYLHEGLERPRLIQGPERVGDYHAKFRRVADAWRISYLQAERLFVVSRS